MIVIMQRSSTLFLAELRCQRLTYIKAFRHTNPHLHVTATAIIPHATHATVNESLIVRSYTRSLFYHACGCTVSSQANQRRPPSRRWRTLWAFARIALKSSNAQPAATPAAVNVASEFRRRVGDDAAVIIINDQKILSSRAYY